jgi:hypothetical protein
VEARGQFLAQATLLPEQQFSIYFYRRLGGLQSRSGLVKMRKILYAYGESNPKSFVVQLVA